MVYGDQLSKHLAIGLADNWSQVRYAASLATREFLMALPISTRENFFPLLLPRICLNRYYAADGVKLYSQETWRQVTAMEGKQLVEKYIVNVVPYYIEATEADNHSVREAACACIGELALKISNSSFQPYVESLLKVLKICLSDDLWKVRDVACMASGNFILRFPDEISNELDSLLPLIFTNLKDKIPSLRQEAATAINHAVKSYHNKAFIQVQEFIITALKGVESQSSEVEMEQLTCGLSKDRENIDNDVHGNNLIYSCGSLAPILGRGVCCACRFKKTQPWEVADGCIYLFGTLCSNNLLHQELRKMMPLIAEACRHKHYAAHFSLLETLCSTLPVIGNGFGKRPFKEQLHLFYDLIFYSLECENSVTSQAAGYCLNELSKFLGPNILRGRIEEFNPLYLTLLDANVSVAPL